MEFFKYLSSVIPVSSQLKEAIEKSCSRKQVKKGDTLIENSKRCSDMYYIEAGLLRGYYTEDGKEITHWFAKEGEFATCFYSFISLEPAQESVQALEDSSLVVIPHSSLQLLYQNFPETERIGRLLTERYYIKLEGRLLSLQFKSAKERYQKLLGSDPSLLQRAQLGHIATYLGISQETLSRIRVDI